MMSSIKFFLIFCFFTIFCSDSRRHGKKMEWNGSIWWSWTLHSNGWIIVWTHQRSYWTSSARYVWTIRILTSIIPNDFAMQFRGPFEKGINSVLGILLTINITILGHWVFGIVDVDTKELRMIPCPDNFRNIETLGPIIRQYVADGSWIWTNSFKTYEFFFTAQE